MYVEDMISSKYAIRIAGYQMLAMLTYMTRRLAQQLQNQEETS